MFNKLMRLRFLVMLVCLPSTTLVLANLDTGNHNLFVDVGEKKRAYILHIPPLSADMSTVPLVINFHGGGDNAKSFQQAVRMDMIADQMGYAVVYPNGTGRWSNKKLTWNAGQCCGPAVSKKIDDVDFVRQLIRDVEQHIALDRERIYVTGFANGGMMAYRLAVEASDLIAAAAPVAGSMAVTEFTPVLPVPIMQVHSIDDPQMPYKGGSKVKFPFGKEKYSSVADVIEQWAGFNQCKENYKVARSIVGGLGAKYAGQKANLIIYSDCEQGAEVSLWQLQGVMHEWPGAQSATQLINLNKEILRFFSRFRRPGNESVSLRVELD
ncbi:hypothetical protein MNBD_GAMMA16-219 [hydrothermal vent metagenome]|uniref:Uncharacterized protein n=1 Tax=hydrothermal vent metagenome TaxID=652676 RepID=A0A3B1A432_9ZZZZ